MAWASLPQTPYAIRLSDISFFTTPPQFYTYFESIKLWFKSSPLSNILLTHQPRAQASDLLFCDIFLPQRVPLFQNFRWHHIAGDLRIALPPIKYPGYANHRIQEILILGYFRFQSIKKQFCSRAEDKTFRGFVGFEAKDFRMCPRGHPLGLNLGSFYGYINPQIETFSNNCYYNQARSQDLEKGGLFWKSEKCANDLDSNFHWPWISFRRFVRNLRRNVSERLEFQRFFPPKIRWSPKKKKKKVFAKIQSDFSAEIQNSNVFSAQN